MAGFAPGAADAGGHRWAKVAIALTGWALISIGGMPSPSWQPPVRLPAALSPEAAEPRATAPTEFAARAPAKIAPPVVPLDGFVPLLRVNLPAAQPAAEVDRAVAPSPVDESAPVIVAAAPPSLTETPAPVPAETPRPALVAALRSVDVEQISEARGRSPRIAQVDPPETGAGEAPPADKAQMAQLSLPRAVERELALLQEDAPAEVAVRFGDQAIGKVAVRLSQVNTIDVQLSGLLDMMADHFAPEEFARLRGSAAADSYVPLDQLRAAGLGLRYDPVYDELVISA